MAVPRRRVLHEEREFLRMFSVLAVLLRARTLSYVSRKLKHRCMSFVRGYVVRYNRCELFEKVLMGLVKGVVIRGVDSEHSD